MNPFLPTRVAVALISVFAIVFGVGAYGLGLRQSEMPGPGLLPFVVALLLLPLVIVVSKETVVDETAFKTTPLYAIAVTCLYALVLPYIGFALATFILVIVWVWLFEQQSLFRAVSVAVILVAAGLGIFVGLLDVPMPLLPAWL